MNEEERKGMIKQEEETIKYLTSELKNYDKENKPEIDKIRLYTALLYHFQYLELLSNADAQTKNLGNVNDGVLFQQVNLTYPFIRSYLFDINYNNGMISCYSAYGHVEIFHGNYGMQIETDMKGEKFRFISGYDKYAKLNCLEIYALTQDNYDSKLYSLYDEQGVEMSRVIDSKAQTASTSIDEKIILEREKDKPDMISMSVDRNIGTKSYKEESKISNNKQDCRFLLSENLIPKQLQQGYLTGQLIRLGLVEIDELLGLFPNLKQINDELIQSSSKSSGYQK